MVHIPNLDWTPNHDPKCDPDLDRQRNPDKANSVRAAMPSSDCTLIQALTSCVASQCEHVTKANSKDNNRAVTRWLQPG